MEPKPLQFRQVTEEDAASLYSLIIEMATYEGDLHEVETNAQKIRDTLCRQSNTAAYICFYENKPVAYIIYFYTYSSYLGKKNLYIEDIYIRPDYRKMGFGKQIMAFAAGIALKEDCSRMDWTCLDWNGNARSFYEHLGASYLKNRLYFRAEKDVLKNIAQDL